MVMRSELVSTGAHPFGQRLSIRGVEVEDTHWLLLRCRLGKHADQIARPRRCGRARAGGVGCCLRDDCRNGGLMPFGLRSAYGVYCGFLAAAFACCAVVAIAGFFVGAGAFGPGFFTLGSFRGNLFITRSIRFLLLEDIR
jgi:hypothetical protein